jgi:hypothetical protein
VEHLVRLFFQKGESMNWIPIQQFDISLDDDPIGNEWLLSDGKSVCIGRASYIPGENGELVLSGFVSDEWNYKPTHFAPLPELPIVD